MAFPLTGFGVRTGLHLLSVRLGKKGLHLNLY